MDGVMNMKREFSSDYEDMKEWKLEVEYFGDCTEIRYMANEEGVWKIKESMEITSCCDELLFKTITKDFEDGTVAKIRE